MSNDRAIALALGMLAALLALLVLAVFLPLLSTA